MAEPARGHYATSRAGVTFDVDLAADPGIVIDAQRVKPRDRRYIALDAWTRYLAARLEGADSLGDIGTRVIAHRLGRLTIHLDGRELGRHFPSAQSVADYITGALSSRI